MRSTCNAELYIRELTVGYVERVPFPGLLEQLRTRAREPYATGPGGPSNNPNKSKSRPPVNQAMLDLVDEIEEGAIQWLACAAGAMPPARGWTTEEGVRTLLLHTANWPGIEPWLRAQRDRCRIMLGHDPRRVFLAHTVCECGGGLSVTADASSGVRCEGTPEAAPCGNVYEPHTWLELL